MGASRRAKITIVPYTGDDYVGEFNLKYAERQLFIETINKAGGNGVLAAEILKINQRTYYEKITLHRLENTVKKAKRGYTNKELEKVELEKELKKMKLGVVIDTPFGKRLRKCKTTSKIVKLNTKKDA